MSRGIKRRVIAAIKNVNEEISVNSRDKLKAPGAPNYAAGLASEGYVGGYVDALRDILLLLDGCEPQRRGYWSRP